jgi:hypothetical protein
MVRNMKEVWWEILRRTIKSRDFVLTDVEMKEGGILEVINVSVAIGFGDIGIDDMKIEEIIRQGQYGRGDDVVVMVESAVKSTFNSFSLRGNYVRVYSGIVFVDEWSLHMFVLRYPGFYGGEMNSFSRLVN